MSIPLTPRDTPDDDIESDARQRIEMWLPLAERGHAHAQFVIGTLFLDGRGVAQDYDTALAWIAKAALQHHAEAQLQFALMHLRGQGTLRDNAAAAHWLHLAAEQGELRAQCYMSRMHAFGLGTPRSLVYAYMWAMLAAMGKWRVGALALSSHNKLRSYALHALESYAAVMTREEVSSAIRMVKRWRHRYNEQHATKKLESDAKQSMSD